MARGSVSCTGSSSLKNKNVTTYYFISIYITAMKKVLVIMYRLLSAYTAHEGLIDNF
jgi:hypothetical protein